MPISGFSLRTCCSPLARRTPIVSPITATKYVFGVLATLGSIAGSPEGVWSVFFGWTGRFSCRGLTRRILGVEVERCSPECEEPPKSPPKKSEKGSSARASGTLMKNIINPRMSAETGRRRVAELVCGNLVISAIIQKLGAREQLSP